MFYKLCQSNQLNGWSQNNIYVLNYCRPEIAMNAFKERHSDLYHCHEGNTFGQQLEGSKEVTSVQENIHIQKCKKIFRFFRIKGLIFFLEVAIDQHPDTVHSGCLSSKRGSFLPILPENKVFYKKLERNVLLEQQSRHYLVMASKAKITTLELCTFGQSTNTIEHMQQSLKKQMDKQIPMNHGQPQTCKDAHIGR